MRDEYMSDDLGILEGVRSAEVGPGASVAAQEVCSEPVVPFRKTCDSTPPWP